MTYNHIKTLVTEKKEVKGGLKSPLLYNYIYIYRGSTMIAQYFLTVTCAPGSSIYYKFSLKVICKIRSTRSQTKALTKVTLYSLYKWKKINGICVFEGCQIIFSATSWVGPLACNYLFKHIHRIMYSIYYSTMLQHIKLYDIYHYVVTLYNI